MSCNAASVPLKTDALGVVVLDFAGGLRVRVEENIEGGLGGVRLKVIGFEMSAVHPALGKVTMRQADTDTTPPSPLEVVADNPPKFSSTFLLDYNLTIEKPAGGGPPMTLANTKTATLANRSLSVFPPNGDVYQLQEPVDLAPIGKSSDVVAQLIQFPVTVSHSP
ncbi:hypothetical protein OS965_32715 [Streptomyces sp. H27-G5]|uniref:hypothetical protein n=1 Tax=Streptomyces sp. H27-G5 TaxID=2996698 RepID=UPI00226F2C76|nr:hypothetical protein [Streptomyces sp. H27-G5]MCY0922852.1 hypothetical protein [Streptomyces sp. H27-G5]